ncbi:MAG: AAA family ATPase [Armatimonadetes bacterium]|nr:AAA family ATPase [Armatimonadota bacterium]
MKDGAVRVSTDVADDIEVLIRARYPVIYVVTWEEARVEEAIAAISSKREKKVFTWSICQGIVPYNTSPQSKRGVDERTRDPQAALSQVLESMDPAIYIFKDFHPYFCDPAVVRKVREVALYLKNSYKTLIIISPTLKLPLELQKDVSVVDFCLPDRVEIGELLERTVAEVNKKAGLNISLAVAAREALVDAALGLTINEAENVFAKTLVKTGGLSEKDVPIILSEKEQIIRKSGMLEYYRATEAFENVGGMEELKGWLGKRRSAFSDEARKFGLPTPKGVLLIGVQGCGKSLCAKAVASLWRVPLLRLDLGRVFSSLVGSSEENVRQAISVAESVAPAILWVDEIEKAFAGTQSSSFSDAGTTSRVFGTFLTWLQEKTASVFVIATANNISQLPPELLRKGRFDEIFFVDLPDRPEREEIFRIHIAKRGRNPAEFDLVQLAEASEGFSGAEIEEAVSSALFDVFDKHKDLSTDAILQTISTTVPLSRTMKEEIERLREWAQYRTRPAGAAEAAASFAGRQIEL